MRAYSSGGAGDIVFQIKIMKMMRIKTLYVLDAHYNEHITIASTVGKLLNSQGIESYPILNPDILSFDYNLDLFREQKRHGHLVKRMLSQFNLPFAGWNVPWLTNIQPKEQCPDVLLNVTSRYREGSPVDWKKVIGSLLDRDSTIGFIGFEEEYKDTILGYFDSNRIPHIRTQNLFEMAQYIQACKALYCNQSAALAIAQGLGKTYYVEHKPEKFNCLMNTSNENILK